MTLCRKRLEIRLESCLKQQEEVEEVALIGRMEAREKGYKKGKKEGSNLGKKDLGMVKCFRYHQLGHYTNQCSKKKKGEAKQIQVLASFVARVDEGSL
jgi:hypothetical protein